MRKYTNLPYIEKDVAVGNFGYSRNNAPIDRIVLHSTGGQVDGALAWFNNPAAGVSAHYVIGNDGTLYALLEEYYVAYHAGNLAMNNRSIGIEHEGYTGMVRSEKEYDTSIKLVADICKEYNIPCDRTHIIAHREVVQTACPTDLDVDRIVAGAYKILHPIDPRDQQIKDLQIKIIELIKNLANKDIECQQRLQDYKDKVIKLVQDSTI